jgi:flagellar basal-body rod modification protein FlgD
MAACWDGPAASISGFEDRTMVDTSAYIPSAIKSQTGTSPSPNSGVETKTATDTATLASNFSTFLTLLTTQLKNQNPLDPLDTNQFTQQLVQFAGVEQQMKMNTQMASLIAIEQAAQSTAAMAYLGSTATVDGSTTKLESNKASWVFNSEKPATGTISISDSTGNLAYSGTFTLNSGQQTFTWDGKGNNGTKWPDGNYKMVITAKDTSGQSVAVSTEVSGVVDSVDLQKTPPTLSIGGSNFTVDKIKRVVRPGI